MNGVGQVLLVGGILVGVGILSTKLSGRIGIPGLVLFLLVGMLAGSEGIGGVAFEDYGLALGIGTAALAIILFDGGLRTSYSAIGRAWKPALVLATVGVLLTALLTGLAAAYLLGLPLLHALLLGSIISSTDAAAVFYILRKQGVRLEERLSATLEVESGSNDPMAVFLTIGFSELILGRMEPGAALLGLFAAQMGIGAAVGVGVGYGGARLINRIRLDAAGLYPVLAAAIGITAFGMAAVLGGSGFLAIYLAGIVLGNQRVVFRQGILLFHDGAAWIAQILMFTLLGLLSFPSLLLGVAGPGLVVSLVLIFLARPLMVALTMVPFGFRPRELALLSWVGLKGAVPVMLATYPLTLGLPEGRLFFDVIFFVVLVSALAQGWTLPVLARRLGLERPLEPAPAVALELTSLRHVDAEIVAYLLTERARAAGYRIASLPLPEGAVVAAVVRGDRVVPPGGGERLRPGDHVFVLVTLDVRPAVERIFGGRPDEQVPIRAYTEFPLRGSTTVGELEEFFGIRLAADAAASLAEVIEADLGSTPMLGDFTERDGARLVVRELRDGRVVLVGFGFSLPEEGPA
jgi:potassium/hydrogen antiporter